MSERTRTENKVDDGAGTSNLGSRPNLCVDKGVLAAATSRSRRDQDDPEPERPEDRRAVRDGPRLDGPCPDHRGGSQSLVSETNCCSARAAEPDRVMLPGLRLGLPTGLLAVLGGGPSEQNATMLQALLAQVGGVRIPKDHFEEIPLYLAADCLPIVTGMPPYHYWEPPPAIGDLPANRTDVGVYMISEVFGTRSMIFVKDEDGLHTSDPKKDPNAEFIPAISVSELRERDLDDLILERACVDLIARARHTKAVQIINGLVPGRIRAALAGEHVGTVIYQDGVDWREELIK